MVAMLAFRESPLHGNLTHLHALPAGMYNLPVNDVLVDGDLVPVEGFRFTI